MKHYAAEQGNAEEEALGMEEKSKEFVEQGAEVYAKGDYLPALAVRT